MVWDAIGKSLEVALKASAAGAVTYTRGVYSVTLRAAPGKSLYERETSGGVIETVESRDFLFKTADLILNSVLTLPVRGDTLAEYDTATGKTYTYEITGPGTEAVYRYADPARRVIRVHTTQISIT